MFGILLLLLAGCSGSPVQETPLPLGSPPSPAITPYFTQTPLLTAAPTATLAPTPTLPPLPSPTPYLYTVAQGDTMIGIAINFGISYDELSLANPEVNPNFLSVGAQLVIPLPTETVDGDSPPETAVPEVLPLETGQALCYPVRSGGLWCYWLVSNSLPQPAENIAGVMRLYNNQGEEIASQPATSLLNLLPPGKSMPLAAYFPPPVGQWSSAQGQLLSAVEANQSETRYLSTELYNLSSEPISDDRLSFQISGRLGLPLPAAADGSPAELTYAWVMATAYDADGAVVGLRRWEAPQEQLGPEISFSFQVYSLGKPIETVELLTESRTNLP